MSSGINLANAIAADSRIGPSSSITGPSIQSIQATASAAANRDIGKLVGAELGTLGVPGGVANFEAGLIDRFLRPGGRPTAQAQGRPGAATSALAGGLPQSVVSAVKNFANDNIGGGVANVLQTLGLGALGNDVGALINSFTGGNAAPQAAAGAPAGAAQAAPRISEGEAQKLVAGFYRDILGRDAANSEIAGWVQKIQSGVSPDAVKKAFIDSPEFQKTGPSFVADLYQSLLGRKGSDKEVQGWVDRLKGGVSRDEVKQGFLGSPEFAGKAEEFVVGLYDELLGRTASEGEVQGWVDRLKSGIGRDEVRTGFVKSPEFAGLAPDIVEDNYQRLLGREPTEFEQKAGIDDLVGGTSPADFIKQLTSSKEYGDKAEPAVKKAFERILDRAPTAKELEDYTKRLKNGESPEDIQVALFASGDYLKLAGGTNEDFVGRLYKDLLGRDPTPEEYAATYDLANMKGRKEAARALVTSDEVRAREDGVEKAAEKDDPQLVIDPAPRGYSVEITFELADILGELGDALSGDTCSARHEASRGPKRGHARG